jgi:hypothetical protein
VALNRGRGIQARLHREREREREREEKWGGSGTLFLGDWGQTTISPDLKVPRQCAFIVLVELTHTIGIDFYMTFEVAEV